MNKTTTKIISLLFSVIIFYNAFSVGMSAADFRTGTNSVSESYRNSIYYKNLTSLPLTGDRRTDVIAIALSQLGYTEGNENGAFSGMIAGGTENYTEYNYALGKIGGSYSYQWCAAFASWCLTQANAKNSAANIMFFSSFFFIS